MIEFKGYISGDAERYFFKKSRFICRNMLLLSWMLISPIILRFFISFNMKSFVFVYIFFIILSMIFIHMPRSKKYKKAHKPNHIYIKDDIIVCVSDKYTESKLLNIVKKVRDHGEFYEIIFPVGNISEKYICQKNLLSNGTFADFEKIFAGKIIRSKEKTGDG